MWLRVGVAVLLVVVAVAVVNYLRPIPSVSATPLLPASQVIPGTAPTLPWPSPGTGAVGVSGLGLVASSGNEQAIPAASVAKVMTALVVLEDKPLNKGDAGPIITLTGTDVQSYESDLADKQSVVQVLAGEQLSELQLLQGMLIPSANNFAETLARWDAGSIDAFVAKMNSRSSALHLAHTKFADPSGAGRTPGSLAIVSLVGERIHAVRPHEPRHGGDAERRLRADRRDGPGESARGGHRLQREPRAGGRRDHRHQDRFRIQHRRQLPVRRQCNSGRPHDCHLRMRNGRADSRPGVQQRQDPDRSHVIHAARETCDHAPPVDRNLQDALGAPD